MKLCLIPFLALLTACSFETPELDASAIGVCLWKRAPLTYLDTPPPACWVVHAPERAALTTFELADPCDAPEAGEAFVLFKPGVTLWAYYNVGANAEGFWAEEVSCDVQ